MIWSHSIIRPSFTITTTTTTTVSCISPSLFDPQTYHRILLRPLLNNSYRPLLSLTATPELYSSCTKVRASLEDIDKQSSPTLLLTEDQPNTEVQESVNVLKNAARTRKVQKNEVLSALAVIEKAKLNPEKFLETLGGLKSPGRTWMLIFTAEKKLKGGRYFPVTAIQRFDAEAKRIENGVYLGPLGCLTFEGRFSWRKRMLAFIFERVSLKFGPFKPLQVSLRQDSREPNTKDPFFIWFYVDEEIAVARGRSGGTAFWCRCRRIAS